MWIVLSSLWELAGFLRQLLARGRHLHHTTLFEKAVDLSEGLTTEGLRAAGMAMSLLVGFLSSLGFVLLCRDAEGG